MHAAPTPRAADGRMPHAACRRARGSCAAIGTACEPRRASRGPAQGRSSSSCARLTHVFAPPDRSPPGASPTAVAMNNPIKFAGSRSTNQLEMRTVITNQKTVMNRSLSAGSRLNPSMQFLQDARRELHKQVPWGVARRHGMLGNISSGQILLTARAAPLASTLHPRLSTLRPLAGPLPLGPAAAHPLANRHHADPVHRYPGHEVQVEQCRAQLQPLQPRGAQPVRRRPGHERSRRARWPLEARPLRARQGGTFIYFDIGDRSRSFAPSRRLLTLPSPSPHHLRSWIPRS